MTAATLLAPEPLDLGFDLADRHLATAPPEARGLRRDGVRLLVSRGTDEPVHTRFAGLADALEPGDLVVVNTAGTRSAAIDARLDGHGAIVLHVSTELPGGLWMVEPRRPLDGGATEPLRLTGGPLVATLDGGATVTLLQHAPGSERLWIAAVAEGVDLLGELARHGRPIRYRYVDRDHPLAAYQTVFATEPTSAEMPSAARPFTDRVVTSLVRRGVGLATIRLDTGVSSLEGHELPYPEHYEVPAATAAAVDTTRRLGGRVIAVGTTVVRALESTVDASGSVHPGRGWTDLVVTPERGVRAVDGLLTGWHEPGASHLSMLEAVAGREALRMAYRAAWEEGYLWHEFGDSHLLLPYAGDR
ncbi:MAG: S-adenosylmethionine:tRNA ribosyltransferase-isomerase [Actinomycetota bacterium]